MIRFGWIKQSSWNFKTFNFMTEEVFKYCGDLRGFDFSMTFHYCLPLYSLCCLVMDCTSVSTTTLEVSKGSSFIDGEDNLQNRP